MTCTTCETHAISEKVRLMMCRRHQLELLKTYDMATFGQSVELFLREHAAYLVVGFAAVYLAAHLIVWGMRGFGVVAS